MNPFENIPNTTEVNDLNEGHHENAYESIMFRDFEGKEIGHAAIQYGPRVKFEEKVRSGDFTGSGRKLHNFKLTGPKGEFSVFSEKDSERLEIIVSDRRLSHYYSTIDVSFDHKSDIYTRIPGSLTVCVVPPLDNLLSVGILLHEMGHGEQNLDPNMQATIDLDCRNSMRRSLLGKARGIIETVDTFPDYLRQLSQRSDFKEGYNRLVMIMEEYPTAFELNKKVLEQVNAEVESKKTELLLNRNNERSDSVFIDELGRALNNLKDLTRVDNPDNIKLKNFKKELQEIIASMSNLDILGYPLRLIERDVAKRVLVKLRRVNKATGFRGFAEVPVDVSHFNYGLSWYDVAFNKLYSAPISTNVIKDFQIALRGYGADKTETAKLKNISL